MKYKIIQDEDVESPREWDNLGKMVLSHRRYSLPNEIGLEIQRQFDNWEEVRLHLEEEKGATVILPIFMMDHSGLTLRVGSDEFRAYDPQGWDWGQVGFAFATREAILENWSRKKLTQKLRLEAEAVLRSEVRVYSQYLSGECFGFVITDDEGEQLDSCWGYFGYGEAEEAAKEAMATLQKDAA